jgi:hypothetical protein
MFGFHIQIPKVGRRAYNGEVPVVVSLLEELKFVTTMRKP